MFEYKLETNQKLTSAALVRSMTRAIREEIRPLVDELVDEYARNFKQAIVTARAIARGELIHSVRSVVVSLGSRAVVQRNITAARHWIFVDRGRRAGAKAPPMAAMIPWFTALNIPQAAWWPIIRAIARRGIEPKRLQSLALRNSQPRWRTIVQFRSRRLAQRFAELHGSKAEA